MTHSFPTRRSSYLFHGQRLGEALLRRVAVTTGVTSFRSRSSGESCSSSSAVQIQSSAITARELRPYDNRARPKATATQEWRARPAGRVDVLRTSGGRALGLHQHRRRSEEHTSELQSLMRISYAVFCLKKKTTNQTTTHINKQH